MGYEIVTKLQCKTNELLDNKGFVKLTIGGIYESAYCNSTPNSVTFGVYDDEGDLCNFSERYFDVYETTVRENMGWEIKCKDCFKEIPLDILIKNDYKCPRCGQKFEVNE